MGLLSSHLWVVGVAGRRALPLPGSVAQVQPVSSALSLLAKSLQGSLRRDLSVLATQPGEIRRGTQQATGAEQGGGVVRSSPPDLTPLTAWGRGGSQVLRGSPWVAGLPGTVVLGPSPPHSGPFPVRTECEWGGREPWHSWPLLSRYSPAGVGGAVLTGQHLTPPLLDWLRHLHVPRSGRPHCETSSRNSPWVLAVGAWELGLAAAGGRILSFWNLLVSLLM